MPVSIPPFTPTALQPNSAETFATYVRGQPAAKTPLDGTELVPIIQNGTTVHAPPGSFNAQAGAPVFYVSPSGNDGASGTSPSKAWQTIGKVNASSFTPGTVILFQGGQTFTGAIVCPSSGTPGAPIIFGSYGGGQATISSGTSNGFTSTSQAGIIVRDLTFSGSASTNHGVFFQNALSGNVHLQNIQAINLNISGYGGNGILVLGGSSGSPSAGYDDILIQGCAVSNCSSVAFGNPAGASTNGTLGTAGITIYSAYGQGLSTNAVSHRNVVIENCVVSSCAGATDVTLSGSGITVSQISDCVIRSCTAANNGASANNTALGGPVGIWCQDCVRVAIQECAVSGQQDAAGVDGGGFDLDAGCHDCIIADCRSSGNQRYGFTIESFVYTNYTSNNNCVVQNCLSDGDLITSGSAGIYITKSAPATLTNFKVAGCQVYYSTAAGGACFQAATSGITGDVTDCSFAVSSNQAVFGTIASGVNITGGANASFVAASTFQFNFFPASGTNPCIEIDNAFGVRLGGANYVVGFTGTGSASGTVDLQFGRDAAGVLQLGNGSLALGGLRAYNTGGGTSNYERGVFEWVSNSNVLTIGTQNNGSGLSRNLEFVVGNANVLDYGVTNSGQWSAPQGSQVNFDYFSTSCAASGDQPGLYIFLASDGSHRRMINALDDLNNPFMSWGPGTGNVGDITMYRDGVGIIGFHNGQNATLATTLRVYNTSDSVHQGAGPTANFERGVLDWTTTSNVLTIGTQKGGSGSTRNIQFVVGGTNELDFGITNSGSWTLNTGTFIGSGAHASASTNDSLTIAAGNYAQFSFNGVANSTIGFACNQGNTGGSAGNGFAVFGVVGTNTDNFYGIDTTHTGLNSGDIVFQTFFSAAFQKIWWVPLSTNNFNVAGGVVVRGDPGSGIASTNTISNANSATISTGTGTVKMSSANNANNTGWLKCYIGTQVAWIPCWTTNAP